MSNTDPQPDGRGIILLAAQAMHERTYGQGLPWERAPQSLKDAQLADARVALIVAAPHIQRRALEKTK